MSPPSPEPIYFGPPDRPLFGWLHQSLATTATLGLVICNPFGYEEVCAHRSMRQFATSASAAGVPSLRFDYDGTGDSVGDEYEADRMEAWLASIQQAGRALQEYTGVKHLCFAGVRLGATLAALAAAKSGMAAGVIAIAPVVKPRAYLRELRAFEAAIGRAPADAPQTGLESAGFAMTEQTCAQLTGVDLTKLDAPASRVLILDRDDLPGAAGWAEHLRTLNTAADYRTPSGYVQMMTSPHASVIPQGIIDEAVQWLGDLRTHLDEPAAPAIQTRKSFTASARMPGQPPVQESALFLDPQRRLFTVVSEPAGGEHGFAQSGRRGILLLNAGATHRIGPSRFYVTLARRWAQQGDVVMRMDLSGIGDSLPHPDTAENDVYYNGATDDIALAIQTLRERFKAREIMVVGLCAGAYHGFKAAVAGLPIDTIVPINPLTFFWKEGMSLDVEFSAERVVQDAKRYQKSAFRLRSWWKLIRGQVDLSMVTQVVARRGLSLASASLRECRRRLGMRLPDDLAWELKSLIARGVQVRFVFAQNDPGIELLYEEGGSAVKRMQRQGRIDIQIIDGANHTFMPREPREQLIALLTERQRDISRHAA